jgi:hypothetical protein
MSVLVSLRGTPRRRENRGGLPADAGRSLVLEPVCKSGAGALTLTGRALCFEHAGQNFSSRPRPPGIPSCAPDGVRRGLA